MSIPHRTDVSLGTRSYPVYVGQGLCAQAADYVPVDGRTVFILADSAVTEIAAGLEQSLKAARARAVHRLVMGAGETAKTWTRLEGVLSWMLSSGVDRHALLFAVGGGVIGDLGGFAAAIVMRGIPFVQVPTTLLAQVDSGVGGKTGINMPQGKNLVGAFHQPLAVLCDLNVLKTLPQREFRAGYAEIVKYGLIDDPEFFIWLESYGADVCDGKISALQRAVETSCRKKARIVAEDEQERSGARALLNLGHTFGHALEAAAGYDGRLLHGEAVAIGTVLAFRLSARLGYCSEADAARVERHLASMNLPVKISDIVPRLDVTPEDLLKSMAHDKKSVGGVPVFILVRGIGRAFVCDTVGADDVLAVLASSFRN